MRVKTFDKNDLRIIMAELQILFCNDEILVFFKKGHSESCNISRTAIANIPS